MAAAPKTFTYAQLEEHKSRDSLYLTIHKKVYDVTPFLDEVSLPEAAQRLRAGSGARERRRRGGRGEERSRGGGGGRGRTVGKEGRGEMGARAHTHSVASYSALFTVSRRSGEERWKERES